MDVFVSGHPDESINHIKISVRNGGSFFAAKKLDPFEFAFIQRSIRF